MKPRINTNARLFERRGDAWISPKEQQRDFGRNLETENPDLDQYAETGFDLSRAGLSALDNFEEGRPGHETILRKAPPRPEYKDPPPIGKGRELTGQLRVTQILLKAKIRERAKNNANRLRIVKPDIVHCPHREFGCGFSAKAKNSHHITRHLAIPIGKKGYCKGRQK